MLSVNKYPNTQPADRDLESRVVAFLASRHFPTLRKLEVKASGGIVTLRGLVHTFHEKQLSHQCGRRVAGVLEIVDEIDVSVAETPFASAHDPRRSLAIG